MNSIEPLEARIAPASLIFLDVDGDSVTIKVSKGPALVVGTNVTLSSGDVATPAVLQKLTLTDPTFSGASVTFTVKKAVGGDGLVNVGFLDAGGVDLGAVTVPGDLGRIAAGDVVTANDPGLTSLKVRSMGALGTLTQAGLGTLASTITGAIGRLEVTRDFIEAQLETSDPINSNATIGTLIIGGDLVGGPLLKSGSIVADDGVGSVTIRGKIIGGAGKQSGEVRIGGALGSATLGGIVGGDGERSGRFEYHGAKAKVLIKGGVLGGSGEDSGALECEGATGTVTVTGAIVGGTGVQSGRLDFDSFKQITVGSITGTEQDSSGSVTGDDGSITERGNVVGGGNFNSGNIDGNNLAAVTIGGNLEGSLAVSGRTAKIDIRGSVAGGDISADSLGVLKVAGNFGSGDAFSDSMFFDTADTILIGGSIIGGGNQSGRITATGRIGELNVRGSIVGGEADSGNVSAAAIGKLTIGHDLKGGGGDGTGKVEVTGFLESVKIGGSIVGNGGVNSGSVSANVIGTMTVGGDVVGGLGSGSGDVLGLLAIKSIRVGGSLIGGRGPDTGQIHAGTAITALTILGDVRGSGFANTGKISANFLGPIVIGGDLIGGDFAAANGVADSGMIDAGTIDSVTLRGSLVAGFKSGAGAAAGASGAIIAGTLGPLVIGGSILGNDSNAALIIARGQSVKPATGDDLAIASLSVKGDVQFAQVLGGFTGFLKTPANADASIGPVTVGGDWRASSLVAGAQDAGAPGFGIGDRLQSAANTALIARIVKITIGGDVPGTAQVPGDHFGFVAERLESLTIAGRKVTLDPGTVSNDDLLLSPTNDIRALEVDP